MSTIYVNVCADYGGTRTQVRFRVEAEYDTTRAFGPWSSLESEAERYLPVVLGQLVVKAELVGKLTRVNRNKGEPARPPGTDEPGRTV